MAFDNVTFFELHVDGARFGGRSDATADEGDRASDDGDSGHHEYADDSGAADDAEAGQRGNSVGRAVAVLALFAVSAAVARRFAGRRGGEESDAEDAELHIEAGDDAPAEPVEVSD